MCQLCLSFRSQNNGSKVGFIRTGVIIYKYSVKASAEVLLAVPQPHCPLCDMEHDWCLSKTQGE